MTRWIYRSGLSILGLLIFFVPACDELSDAVSREGRKVAREFVSDIKDKVRDNLASRTAGTVFQQTPAVLQRTGTEITIGSWNIQKFGQSKMSKTSVMQVLVSVARQFDVLAIQEIQARNDENFLDKFVAMINSNGSQYSYVLSAPVGTVRYSEQYAFVYDTTRIELVDGGGLLPDPHNLMSREPMFSRFRTRHPDPNQAFGFALLNVHTAPSETRRELATLYEMFLWLQSYLGRFEDDIIMLGDFNEPPRKYGQLWQIRSLVSVLDDNVTTNTRRTKSYDNILMDGNFTHEYTRKAGIIDLQREFGLTFEQAEDVSDHLPVWASFVISEHRGNGQFARQPAGVR